MVRGVSRRVIVVKPEQPALFEQAIFLVRDYNAPRGDMVREACRIANSYLPRRRRSFCKQIIKRAAVLLYPPVLVGIL